MSVGAVTHHFETREVLVDTALRFALTREMNRLRALAFSCRASIRRRGMGWGACELVFQRTQTETETHIACYEAFLAATRSTRHRPIVIEWSNLATKRGACSQGRGLV